MVDQVVNMVAGRRCASLRICSVSADRSFSSLKENVCQKMKKYGKISSVFYNISSSGENDIILTFESSEALNEAINANQSISLFGKFHKIVKCNEISIELEQFHLERIKKEISRFIYISGSEKQMQKKDVHEFFAGVGRILDLEIHQRSNSTSILIQFESSKSASAALRIARLKNLGLKPVKRVDFESTSASKVVHITSLPILSTDTNLIKLLKIERDPVYYIFDSDDATALLYYSKLSHASEVVKNLNYKMLNLRFFECDYANKLAETDFFNRLEKSIMNKHSNFIKNRGFMINSRQEVVLRPLKGKNNEETLENYKRRKERSKSRNRSSPSPSHSVSKSRLSHPKSPEKKVSYLDIESDISSSGSSQYSFKSELSDDSYTWDNEPMDLSNNSNQDESEEHEYNQTEGIKDPISVFTEKDNIDIQIKSLSKRMKATNNFIFSITNKKKKHNAENSQTKPLNENKVHTAGAETYSKLREETLKEVKEIIYC
ncbi:MAG: hypothetical protein MHPSP_000103 [Paramarteilia canceri]